MKKIKSIFAIAILTALSITINAQTEFTLPKLPYGYADLEPYIDAQTMEIHYTKHHNTYVTNLNKAIEKDNIKVKSLEDLVLNASKYHTAVRNNAGGHYNHTLFWNILSPNPQSKPEGQLAQMINSTFGSFDKFKHSMNEVATSRFGSGWAWLIVTKDHKLIITSSQNQDNPLMDISDTRGIPILGIDVWEHAYYLKYQNKRADYLDAIWYVIDWKKVEQNFNNAMKSETLKKL